MNTYLKWFWSECDELNKDTSFAYSLAEKAWNYRQTEIDELKAINDNLQKHLNDKSQYIKNLEHKNKELQILLDTPN